MFNPFDDVATRVTLSKAIGLAIRHGLNGVGVYCISHGFIDAKGWEDTLAGISSIAIAAAWSYYEKHMAEQEKTELARRAGSMVGTSSR